MPAINPLPALDRTSPTFKADTDVYFGSLLPIFSEEASAAAEAMNLNSTNDTSVSNVLVGTGAKTFAVSTGKSYQPGMYLVIADTAAPSTNSMFGQITSYDTGTGELVMNILLVRGSGTKTAWLISQSSGGVAPGVLLRITRYSAAGSGTWTPGSGTISALVRALGAGGGGGGSPAGVTSGGGGGAGPYAELYLASVAESYAYTVGAGGGGGATGGAGGTGGSTTIAGITATGGTGGIADNGQGGLGGTATGGDINVAGGAGVAGNTGDSAVRAAIGGTGGSSFYGGAGRGNAGTGAAGVFGGGGGGSGASANGGAGGAGYIEIWEYA